MSDLVSTIVISCYAQKEASLLSTAAASVKPTLLAEVFRVAKVPDECCLELVRTDRTSECVT